VAVLDDEWLDHKAPLELLLRARISHITPLLLDDRPTICGVAAKPYIPEVSGPVKSISVNDSA
jgi:hypothetical protein